MASEAASAADLLVLKMETVQVEADVAWDQFVGGPGLLPVRRLWLLVAPGSGFDFAGAVSGPAAEVVTGGAGCISRFPFGLCIGRS